MPRSDSARLRGQSQLDFKTATTGVAAKAMRNELSNLVKSVSDAQTKKVRYPSADLFRVVLIMITAIRRRDAILLLPLHALSRQACKRTGAVRLRYIFCT